MFCPYCHTEFESWPLACPGCGIHIVRSVSGVIKTSAIMIAADGEQAFYHSVKDVPEPLRKKLIETTGSPNSGTIVIADKNGREQITQVMARREARATAPENAYKAASTAAAARAPVRRHFLDPRRLGMDGGVAWLRKNWLASAGVALVLALAGIASALFGLRW
jgi:hypothetical protein